MQVCIVTLKFFNPNMTLIASVHTSFTSTNHVYGLFQKGGKSVILMCLEKERSMGIDKWLLHLLYCIALCISINILYLKDCFYSTAFLFLRIACMPFL